MTFFDWVGDKLRDVGRGAKMWGKGLTTFGSPQDQVKAMLKVKQEELVKKKEKEFSREFLKNQGADNLIESARNNQLDVGALIDRQYDASKKEGEQYSTLTDGWRDQDILDSVQAKNKYNYGEDRIFFSKGDEENMPSYFNGKDMSPEEIEGWAQSVKDLGYRDKRRWEEALFRQILEGSPEEATGAFNSLTFLRERGVFDLGVWGSLQSYKSGLEQTAIDTGLGVADLATRIPGAPRESYERLRGQFDEYQEGEQLRATRGGEIFQTAGQVAGEVGLVASTAGVGSAVTKGTTKVLPQITKSVATKAPKTAAATERVLPNIVGLAAEEGLYTAIQYGRTGEVDFLDVLIPGVVGGVRTIGDLSKAGRTSKAVDNLVTKYGEDAKRGDLTPQDQKILDTELDKIKPEPQVKETPDVEVPEPKPTPKSTELDTETPPSPAATPTIKEFNEAPVVKIESEPVNKAKKAIGIPETPPRAKVKEIKDVNPLDPVLLNKQQRTILDAVNNSQASKNPRIIKDSVEQWRQLSPDEQMKGLYGVTKIDEAGFLPNEWKEFQELAKKGSQNAEDNIQRNAFIKLQELIGDRTISPVNKNVSQDFLAELGRYYDGMVRKTKGLKENNQWKALRNTARSLYQSMGSEAGTVLTRLRRNQELLFGKNYNKVWETLSDPKIYEPTAIARTDGVNLVGDIIRKNIIAGLDAAPAKAKVASGYRKYLNPEGKSLSKLGEDLVKNMSNKLYDVSKRIKDAGLTRPDGTFDWSALENLEDARPLLYQLETTLKQPKITLDALTPRTKGSKLGRLGGQVVDSTTLNLVGSVSTMSKIVLANLFTSRFLRARDFVASKLGRILGQTPKGSYTFADYVKQEALDLGRTLNVKKSMQAWWQSFKNAETQLGRGTSLNVLDRGVVNPRRSTFQQYVTGLADRITVANLVVADNLNSAAVRYTTETASAKELFNKAGMDKARIKAHTDTIFDMRAGNKNKTLKEQVSDKNALENAIKQSAIDIYKLDDAQAELFLDQWYKNSEQASNQVKMMDADALWGVAGKVSDFFNRYKALKPPFVFSKTIINLFNFGVNVTPGMGLLKAIPDLHYTRSKFKQDWGIKRGAEIPEELKARLKDVEQNQLRKAAVLQGFGGGLLAVGWGLGGKDGVIVGALPRDEASREQWRSEGKIPFSIKVGDKYYATDFLAPVLSPVFMGSSMKERTEELFADGEGDLNDAVDVMLTGAATPLHAMAEIPVLTAAQDIQTLVTAPEGEALLDRGYRIMTAQASRVVPGLVKWAARIQDPKDKDPVGWIERSITQYLPFLRKSVADEVVMGKTISESPYDYSLGVKTREVIKDADDPVFKEKDRIWNPEVANNYFTENPIEMSDFNVTSSSKIYSVDGEEIGAVGSGREADRINRDTGKSLDQREVKELNRSYSVALYDELARWMETDDYKEADDAKKRQYWRQIKETVRESFLRDAKEGTSLEVYVNPIESTAVRAYRDPDRQPRYTGGGEKTPAQKLDDAKYELEMNKDPDKTYELKEDVALAEVDVKYAKEEDVLEWGKKPAKKLADKLNRVLDEEGEVASRELFAKIVSYNKDRYDTGYLSSRSYFDADGNPKPPKEWDLYEEPVKTTSSRGAGFTARAAQIGYTSRRRTSRTYRRKVLLGRYFR